MSEHKLHVVVLAAGASARFGSPKQLALVKGVPMLLQTVQCASAITLAGDTVSVVLGANAAQIAPVLAPFQVELVINHAWVEGLAASIRAGIEHVPDGCAGVLLCLADQPAVTAADLQRLIELWRRDPGALVAAEYGGGHGVPAIFPRSHFPALLALRGERGARALLARPTGRLLSVSMPAAALDVDTVQDLQSFSGL